MKHPKVYTKLFMHYSHRDLVNLASTQPSYDRKKFVVRDRSIVARRRRCAARRATAA